MIATRVLLFMLACWLLGVVSAASQPNYPDFSSTTGLSIHGDATQQGNLLRLTPAWYNQHGGVWYDTKVQVDTGFITMIQFRIWDLGGNNQMERDGSITNGGDGIAFVIQNTDFPLTIGGYGGRMGYDPLPNSIAVEFDTWDNSDVSFEQSANHIAVHSNGVNDNHFWITTQLAYTGAIPNLSDGTIHTAIIKYVPGLLTVYLDDCATPRLQVPVRLDTLLNLDSGRAFVGLTSATGSAFEAHDVYSFQWGQYPLRYVQTAPPDTICAGGAILLTAPIDSATYLWSTGDTSRSITVDSTGTYSVLMNTPVWGGCGVTEVTWIKSIMVHERPEFGFVGISDHWVCPGERIMLSLDRPFMRYRWNTGDMSSMISAGPGTYTVTVWDTTGCVWSSDPITVYERQPPVPVIVATDSIVCEGATTALGVTDRFAAYEWSTGERTPTITAGPGTYFIEVTDSNGCRGISAPIIIGQHPVVSPRLAVSPSAVICEGDTAVLGVSGRFTSYTWSTGTHGASLSVSKAGSYWVAVIDSNGCAWRSDTVTIQTVRPGPVALRTLGNPVVCYGDSVTIIAEPRGMYIWSTGDTASQITVGQTGVYWARQAVVGTCPPQADTIAVTVRDPVLVPAIVCAGTSLTSSEGASYRWFYNGKEVAPRTQTIMPTEAGWYEVETTDENGCTARSVPYRWIIVNVEASSIDANLGDTIEVVLTVDGDVPMDSLGLFAYEVEFKYNATVLHSLDLQPTVLGDTASIKHQGVRQDSILGRYRFVVLLGDSSEAAIDIRSFRFINGPCVAYRYSDGRVKVAPECMTDYRRFEPTDEWLMVKRISPNPTTTGMVEIEIEVGKATSVEVVLFDPMLHVVDRQRFWFDDDRHTFLYQTDVASGNYNMVLFSDWGMSERIPVTIIR